MMRRTPIFALVLATLGADLAAAQAIAPVRPIRAHKVIDGADLQVMDTTVPGAVTEMAALIGKEARVTLYTGRPIQSDQVGPPTLIERNQLVRMNFAQGPLSITTEGRALDRAGIGERVRVMNMASRQIVTGKVGADGSIEVGQ